MDYAEQYGKQLAQQVKSDGFATPAVLVQLAWPVTATAAEGREVSEGTVRAANTIIDYYQRKVLLVYIREMLKSTRLESPLVQ